MKARGRVRAAPSDLIRGRGRVRMRVKVRVSGSSQKPGLVGQWASGLVG
mgnify:CR=1 FL=1